MNYPVEVTMPDGSVFRIRNMAEHAVRMARCAHLEGWPPGVCVLCLSARVRV